MVVMSGGGSTGPRPHPEVAKAATMDTKHNATARRIVRMEMSAVSAPAVRYLIASQPTVRWPQALGASVLGPLLLSLAFPKLDWGIFAFIALIPLFLLWSKSSWKQAFVWGLVAGVTLFGLLLNWTTHSLSDFIGGWWVLGLVLICLWQGLNIALIAVATSLVCRGEFRTIAIFAMPAAWLLGETWRTRGSMGVPFGELGLAAVHLPWLLPLAAYGGVYLLTALIALANGAIAGMIAGTPRARNVGAVVLGVLVVIVALGDIGRNHFALAPPSLRVGIAQGNISQREKWSPGVFAQTIATYAALTQKVSARGAKVVIWPETAVTSWPLQDPLLLHALETIAQKSNVWLITGMIDKPKADAYYNAMLDLSPKDTVGGVYHKRWLVPFAEYLPWEAVLGRIPIMDNVSRFLSGPGPHLLPAAGFQWGVLICYESAFAPYARATANAGSDAIIVATDDAWFGGTTGPNQHADIAIVDAVSTGRWIVRGADTGISMIVGPKGDVVALLPINRRGVIVADIGRGVETPYDRFGIAWLLGLALLVLIAAIVPTRTGVAGWRSKRGVA